MSVTLISTPSDDKVRQVQGTTGRLSRKSSIGSGNLFVKTHPKSKNLWADAPQNPERDVAEFRGGV